MAQEIVTLYDLNGEPLDRINLPLNSQMEPGVVLTHMGRKFVRGGGPDSLCGPDEYHEIQGEE